MTIKELIEQSHATAKEKGWWDNKRHFLEVLMLVVGELSEASEEFRDGMDFKEIKFIKKTGKPVGIPIEIADVFIRLGDLCAKYEIPVEKALEIKMIYNKKRSYRHGGKKS